MLKMVKLFYPELNTILHQLMFDHYFFTERNSKLTDSKLKPRILHHWPLWIFVCQMLTVFTNPRYGYLHAWNFANRLPYVRGMVMETLTDCINCLHLQVNLAFYCFVDISVKLHGWSSTCFIDSTVYALKSCYSSWF